MLHYQIKAGTTDVSVVLRVVDSTDGTPETGVDHATSGIDLKYRREGAANVDITEAALADLTTAHTDGGVEQIGNGYIRVDLPDAACATGAMGVLVHGTITGMVVIGAYIQLVAYDPQDAVRLGLTALPNAAADAAGGLPISDAGGLDLDSKLANTNEVTAARMGALTDWINGGRLDLILDARASQATADAIETDTQDIQGRLPAALTGGGNIKSDLLALNGSTSSASKLERSASTIVTGTVDTGTFTATTTEFEADDITEATADHYNGRIIIFTSGALSGQATDITDYALSGANGHFTVTALTEAPANDVTFVIV